MRVDVFPRQADITPAQPLVLSITVTNTTNVIGGYSIRVLGADPGWVKLDVDEISLFPDEARTLIATLTPPAAIPAGPRRLAIQVRELTPPNDVSITELDLTVPAAKAVQVRVDPLTVTAGRSASFSVIAENTGNTAVAGHLDGVDPEGKVRFRFEPGWISLAPGEHTVVDLRASARRNVIGTPAVRMLGLFLDETDDPFFGETERRASVSRADRAPLANATFIQRSVLSRGAISLVGLLVAISVFAAVITIGLSRLVGQTAADRDLALQVAEARNAGSSTGTSGIAGTARLLTTGKPEAGVSVSVFSDSDTTKPVATTATDKNGAYQVGQLPAGGYKLSFRGAGFVQLWYPAGASDSDATTVRLAAGQQKNGINVTLGGVPATISGTVSGDDVAAATLYLETAQNPASAGSSSGSGGTGTPSRFAGGLSDPTDPPATGSDPGGSGGGGNGGGGNGNGSGNPVPNDGNAIVQSVPIGSDGTFTLTNVPSPSVYQLVVTKIGFATSTQRLDVSAGENRDGVQISLRKGDGLITGTVSSPSGPLGGVSITATSGQNTVSTVSLTDTNVGSFSLRSLPTPGSFTLVARKAGYTTQTLTLSLAAGQKLTGVAVSLGRSSGSLAGTVDLGSPDRPAGGVSVTVTDWQRTVQTQTESSGDIGNWQVGGLPVPGTYTVTFSRADLASQTVSASLDAAGRITPGSQGARVDGGQIVVSMQPSTGIVYGTVRQLGGTRPCNTGSGLGEASITLNSGQSSYTVTSASAPAAQCGAFRVENLPPGTYTLTVAAGSGTTPSSRVFTLKAGDLLRRDVTLLAPASVSGTVLAADGTPIVGASVFLYAAADYPGQISQTVRTGAGGQFLFAGVDAGDYVIAASVGGDPNESTTRRITVQPSKRTTTTIRVAR